MKRMAGILIPAALLTVLLPIAVSAAPHYIPVGRIVGLQLRDNTVTVAAFDEDLGNQAKNCGLKIGDSILKVNGMDIDCADDVREALSDSSENVQLTVRRGSRQMDMTLTPENTEDGPRLGVYLRQGVAGVGTVTWYDPESRRFGALGHGVNDSGGCLMNMTRGDIFPAQITDITKGRSGTPGQLKGSADSTAPCGEVLRNTPQGVFGIAPRGWTGKPVEAAAPEELHTGNATILSTIQGDNPQEYSVEIVKLYPTTRKDGRNLLLRVTDSQLLETTGGIVQGMSGSPILQDGKLVGAVTHVLVNDPAMGYGIFIGNMLDAAA